MSHVLQEALTFVGITSAPALAREPAGNGCAERFIRTRKEHLDVCFVNTPPVIQTFPWERRRLACFRSGLETRAPRPPSIGKGLVK
jgi:hypothetical protein